MKYCTKCGTELNDSDLYCSNCGTSQYQQNNSQNINLNANIKFGSDNKPKEKVFTGSLVGILFSSFLGIIGIIICCIWGDEKCKKASIITLVARIAVIMVFYLVCCSSVLLLQ